MNHTNRAIRHLLITTVFLLGFTIKSYSRPLAEILVSPLPATTCANGNTSFSFTEMGGNAFQWQVSTGGAFTNITNGGMYSGANTTTLTITGVPAGNNGYSYRGITITDATRADTSAPALLTVNPLPSITSSPANMAICPGGSTTFTAAATNGTISYKWQVDNGTGFVNISDGGIYSNSATATLSITGATTALYGYSYRAVATNTCGSTNSNAAALTFSNNWTGTTSTLWNVGTNWSCNTIPDANTDVIINTTANAPTVDANSSAHNINIGSGATLTISPSMTLTTTGNITNLGTLVANAGTTVSYTSAGAQTIPANTYYNLTVGGGGNKTLAADITVNGTITFSGSTKIVLGTNTLTMGASATYTGANSTNYFVTTSTGGLKKNNVGGSTFVWPIGNATAYNPLTLSNSGTVDNFTAHVIDGAYTSYNNDVPQGTLITTKTINKTWILTEDVLGGSNATLTVQWNTADVLSGFNSAKCFLSHYEGGAWNSGNTLSAAAGANPYTQTRTGITSFSPFGVGSIGSPLPLDLISFTGAARGKNIDLNWETANEKNINNFSVERSDDGIAYKNMGSVAATSKAGNNKYLFTDAGSFNGQAKFYYRLKINELDGSSEYSRVVSVGVQNAQQGAQYQISPNPVTGTEVYVQAVNATGRTLGLSLIDMTGKTWYKQSAALAVNGTDKFMLNIKEIPAGVYMLQVKDDASVQTFRVVKN